MSQEPSVLPLCRISIPSLNCNADHRSLDAVLLGDGRHLLRVGGGNQDARRSFVEGQDFGAEVAIQIDLRADFGRPEAAFGERHGETAIAEIVRRFGEARGDDFADGLLHALLMVQIERGRQAPKLLFDFLGVLRAAEANLVAGAGAAQQDYAAAGVLERDGHRRGGLHQARRCR